MQTIQDTHLNLHTNIYVTCCCEKKTLDEKPWGHRNMHIHNTFGAKTSIIFHERAFKNSPEFRALFGHISWHILNDDILLRG